MNKKVILVSNTDGALYKFRRPLLRKLNAMGICTIGIASPNSPEGSYSEKLNVICDRLYLVNFVRQGWASFFRSPLEIYKICKNEQPDIIHIYGHEALVFSALAFFATPSTHFFVTITGLGRFFAPKASLFQRVVRLTIISFYFFALNAVSKVMFLNTNDLNEFSRIFPQQKHKFTLINGEGSDFSVASHKNLRRKETLRFLFASRLMEEKGIIELLKAFRCLPKTCHLTVLGSIDDAVRNNPEIISLIEGHMENVEYFGFVADITDILTNSDCVVLPTKYMEGLPIILVEALAKGKFIITSEAPGCADTVVENINGFLLKDVNTEAIVHAILSVSSVNLEEAHEVSTKLFLSKFNAETVINRVIEEYDLEGTL